MPMGWEALAAWGDADHQLWSFTEDEYRDAVRRYIEARTPSR